MSKYKIYTQKPSKVTFDMADGKFDLEMEALSSIDAEIIEVDAKSEDEFIEAVKDADAIIARGRKITRKINTHPDQQRPLFHNNACAIHLYNRRYCTTHNSCSP